MTLSTQLQSLKTRTAAFDAHSPADIVTVVNEVVAIIETLIQLVTKIEAFVATIPSPKTGGAVNPYAKTVKKGDDGE